MTGSDPPWDVPYCFIAIVAPAWPRQRRDEREADRVRHHHSRTRRAHGRLASRAFGCGRSTGSPASDSKSEGWASATFAPVAYRGIGLLAGHWMRSLSVRSCPRLAAAGVDKRRSVCHRVRPWRATQETSVLRETGGSPLRPRPRRRTGWRRCSRGWGGSCGKPAGHTNSAVGLMALILFGARARGGWSVRSRRRGRHVTRGAKGFRGRPGCAFPVNGGRGQGDLT